MKKGFYIALSILFQVIIFALLTLFTQVGGLIYLAAFVPFIFVRKKIKNRWALRLVRTGFFIVLYAICSVWVLPPLARRGGRVPLPVTSNEFLKPATAITYLCNRHYVSPELKTLVAQAAAAMAQQYPGTVTSYLEAGFPFINGYPLWPHITHNDGKKLDIAFYYTHAETGASLTGSPSAIGYGVCEGPLPGETDQPRLCKEKGFWKYGAMESIVPQDKKSTYRFDAVRTKALLTWFANNAAVYKIFIEPHLVERMKLTDSKFRHHGCHTVRHDDHMHITIK